MNINLRHIGIDHEHLIDNIIGSSADYRWDGIFLNAYFNQLDIPHSDPKWNKVLDELSDEVKKLLKKYLMKDDEKEEEEKLEPEEEEFYRMGDTFSKSLGAIYRLSNLGSESTEKGHDEMALVMVAAPTPPDDLIICVGYIWRTERPRYVKDCLKITKKEFNNITNGDAKYFHKIEETE